MLPAGWWPVIGGGLGLLLGSFIALLTARWPQGETILGRSRCDRCGARLGALELVPVLSHIILRGRCRHCGQAIAARHWQIELAAAVIGAGLLWQFPALEGLLLALAGWWLLALLILDAEHQWLPDALTLPLIPFALLLPGLPMEQRLWGAGLGFAVHALPRSDGRTHVFVSRVVPAAIRASSGPDMSCFMHTPARPSAETSGLMGFTS
jgi:leader peptidase (prepilin peptidase)/N-methyltransferase